MKRRIYGIVLLFFGSVGMAMAQGIAMNRSASLQPGKNLQGTSISVIPPMSDFERLSGEHFGHPVVELTFPTVSTELSGDTTLKLTPQSLALFDQPGGPRAFAVLLSISRNATSSPSADVSSYSSYSARGQSVTTYLDDDELSELVALLRKLSATGVPPAPTLMPNAKVVVSIIIESGMRFEFTAEPGGVIHCKASNDNSDAVDFSINADQMNKVADTFWSVKENLHVARESLR